MLLDNLIDAVNSTNWWMFGVSAISALASFGVSFMLYKTTKKIGERQNLLQAQQIYLPLYRNLDKLHTFVCCSFLQSICKAIALINDKELSDKILGQLEVDLRKHREVVMEDLAPIKLLLEDGDVFHDLLYMLFGEMEPILQDIRQLVVKHRRGDLIIDSTSCLKVRVDTTGPMEAICRSIADYPEESAWLKRNIESYLERANYLFHNQDGIMKQIERECRIKKNRCWLFRIVDLIGKRVKK